jgi:hypothetical protein
MTDEQVEKIIRANMGFQMNMSGIRRDFEEHLKNLGLDLQKKRKNSSVQCLMKNPMKKFLLQLKIN